jgi:hypothetical protein
MDVSWVDSAGAKAVAGTFAGLASIVTIQHIYMQLRYFQNTKLQVCLGHSVHMLLNYRAVTGRRN